MLIHEVCESLNLTKKAVEYYTGKGLVVPEMLANGYRDYKEEDVELLRRIGVLRKLGLNMEDIKKVLGEPAGGALQRVIAQKEMKARQNARKDDMLRELLDGKPYSELEKELQALEMEETVAERLLDAFPGYYGRFVSMHFSRFLGEPAVTEEQQAAYETVLSFIDQMPAFEIPEDVEREMSEAVNGISSKQIEDMFESVKYSIERPEDFFDENREVIERYWTYRKSEEFKASPAGRWMEYMREFQRCSGYTEIFLPAMRRLSPSYAEYCLQMDRANEKLLERYPEAKMLYEEGE